MLWSKPTNQQTWRVSNMFLTAIVYLLLISQLANEIVTCDLTVSDFCLDSGVSLPRQIGDRKFVLQKEICLTVQCDIYPLLVYEFTVQLSFSVIWVDVQKQDDQHELTYSNYVRTQDVTLKTCRRRWMIGRSGERRSGISVLAARHDDDEIYSLLSLFGI